jgi:hypothetical protein
MLSRTNAFACIDACALYVQMMGNAIGGLFDELYIMAKCCTVG